MISRAISQELFLLDETLSMVLFSAHFDTFFPAVEWLKACPLCLDHFVLARGSGNG